MKHRGTPAALAAQLKVLYQTHKSAVENAELEYGTEDNSVMVLSEVLSVYTGDSASEIKIERIKDGTEVPDDFDIDTVVTVTETETLVTTSFYVRTNGTVEVSVVYDEVGEVYSGPATETALAGVSEKLKRAVALYPEGIPELKD